ncbi:hypothetical protein Pcinc_001603 [Petrolisthes cinctipes]|uniref:Ig-like domain-containing protein n=1 Tax=Petrolisthes cinctipes TaxID=88211 RepID=A0AAE1G9I1_PETCI|nr:hypothetical protein Pcinc_007422 [Petrolisthes cinctipes]KAK3894625.1 hypothetical protein Pcinc_001603 [Petrolisthes cinctipes]
MRTGSVVGVSGWGNIDMGSDGRTLQVPCSVVVQHITIQQPQNIMSLLPLPLPPVPPVIAWKKSGVMGSVGLGEGGRTCCSRVSLTPSRHWDAPPSPSSSPLPHELLRCPQSVPILSKQTLQGSRWEEEDFPTLSDSPTVHDVTHSENRTWFSLENRYEDINSFDNYNKVYDYTYEYPVSALTPPDREGEQRRNNTGWYSISKDRTRLTLPRITRTEEGLYSCEITKQAGSTRRIFRVDALAQ